ncbi:MAG: diguanylate cyclase, partial [Actinomycetota bacterium]
RLGESDADHYAPEHAALAAAQEQGVMRTGEALHVDEEQRWPDGSTTWVSTTKLPLRDAEGRVFGTFGISRDITARVAAERRAHQAFEQLAAAKQALELAEAEARTLIDLSPDSIVRFDRRGRYVSLNRAAQRLVEGSVEDVLGRTLRELGHPEAVLAVWETGLARAVTDAQAHELLSEHVVHGIARWFATHLIPEIGPDGDVVAVLAISRDVTDSHTEGTRLRHEATHDALTGLYNRAYLHARLTEGLTSSDGGVLALLFVDLDDFKSVNDDHGHGVGDDVLRELARRLESTARTGDVVARLGGDEFVIALQLPDEQVALQVADRYRRAVTGIPVVDDRTVSASVGIAVQAVPVTGPAATSAEDLLRRADRDMYSRKRSRVT